jgi:hypothetical protein
VITIHYRLKEIQRIIADYRSRVVEAVTGGAIKSGSILGNKKGLKMGGGGKK